MKDSCDRILTTHAGSLARPAELREMLAARDEHRGIEALVEGARLATRALWP